MKFIVSTKNLFSKLNIIDHEMDEVIAIKGDADSNTITILTDFEMKIEISAEVQTSFGYVSQDGKTWQNIKNMLQNSIEMPIVIEIKDKNVIIHL